MPLLNDSEHRQVEEAVRVQERRTSGEIVVVLAAQSDSYNYIPILWAAVLALFLPWPLIFFTWVPVQTIFALQIAVFLIVLLLTQLPAVRLALVPRSVKSARCHRHAVELFLSQKLHGTANRAGVMIFASEAEHHAEVLADTGILDKIDQDEWQQIVAALTGHITRGEAVEGFLAAVARIGDHLAVHFPPQPGDDNTLPDNVIIIE